MHTARAMSAAAADDDTPLVAGAAAEPPTAGAAAASAGGGETPSCPAATDSHADSHHYDEVAANYEAAFFYSSLEYRKWVLSHLLRHMHLPDPVSWQGREVGRWLAALLS